MLLSVLVQSSLASITSERLTASSASPSSSPFELCQAKQDHFWSPHFRSCLSCTPCLSTLVPCGPTNDAECDDSNSASAISRIRDRNRNEAGTKTELMDGLRKRRRNRRRKNKPSNFMAIKEAMEREEVGSSEEDEEVDGKVQYMATAPGDNSLHADLQEIERELYMDRMGIPRDGDNGNGFASASTLPFSAASVSSTEPALVLGKKRFYAASSKAKKLSNGEEGNDSDDDDDNDDDTPRDVYGAVIQNPLLHSTTAPHDEIGILHSLLLDGSAEETSTRYKVTLNISLIKSYNISYFSSGSSSSSTGSGFRLEHGLIVIAFCSVALVLAVAALGYVKWKKVQRFKMLDNNSECNLI